MADVAVFFLVTKSCKDAHISFTVFVCPAVSLHVTTRNCQMDICNILGVGSSPILR